VSQFWLVEILDQSMNMLGGFSLVNRSTPSRSGSSIEKGSSEKARPQKSPYAGSGIHSHER
jgi:hypothetical protein